MLFISPHAASLYDTPHIGILASVRRGGRKDILGSKPWAADNECFNGAFEVGAFTRWLEGRIEYRDTCKFILAPDVVGDWAATLGRFAEWAPIIRGMGYPVGIALQDGATAESVPWGAIDAVFIGGATEWKLARGTLDLCRQARGLGKWVHVGRVNSTQRIRAFWDVADSFDGSKYDMFHKTWVPEALAYMNWRKAQMPLFKEAA